MTTASWRRMSPQDIDGVLQVADKVHPNLPEDKEVITERLRLFPEGCLVLVHHQHHHHHQSNNTDNNGDDGNETICGYAISHPLLKRHNPPALNSLLNLDKEEKDEGNIVPVLLPFGQAEQYYIHDLAILPEHRGRGHAAECIEILLEIAKRRGYDTTSLVSVYGTTKFWGRFGFVPGPVGDDEEILARKLCGYGPDAAYLVHQTPSD